MSALLPDISSKNLSFETPKIEALQERFRDKIAELKNQRDATIHNQAKKPRVAILGGGPAGLMRAILASINGNKVIVIEKRAKDHERRLNGIMLTFRTIEILKKYGIYHYLIEQKLLGTPSNEKSFSCSVTIGDLEVAMKAVLHELQGNDEVILYQTTLDHVVKVPTRPIDLVLKIERRVLHTLRSIDVMIVAEGVKSDTIEKILNGRRIEALPPISVIGGIFKTAQEAKKSFFVTVSEVASAVVLYTPGLCSIGCLPLSKTYDSLKELSQSIKRANNEEAEKRKKQFFKKTVDQIFSFEAANNQKAPSFDDNLLVNLSTISSDFTLPFCGRVGHETLFFLCGDSLSQVDATSAQGANNAIGAAKDILPALNGAQSDSAHILNEYTKKTAEKIEKSMGKLKCARFGFGDIYPFNEKVYSFALWQLKQHKAVERVQNIVGATFLKMCLQVEWGRRLFRYIVDKRA